MKIQDRVTIIYTLSCPVTNIVKYIGKTSKPLNTRFREHINESVKGTSIKSKWIKSLVRKGLEPIIEPLDEVVTDCEKAEIYWIAQFKAWGFKLKNSTEGGEGQTGRKFSIETRKRISERQKGIKRSKQIYEKRSITVKQNNSQAKTPEWKYKISQSNKGRKYGTDYKENCRKRMAGRRLPWVLKSVSQYTKQGEFIARYDCVRDAANIIGILETSISMCINGKSKSAGGYIWKRKETLAIDSKTLK